MGVYKLSTAGGLATPRTNYSSFLAGNAAFNPSKYESIATVTLSSAASNVEFTSIPNTYKHLQIRWIARGSYNSANNIINLHTQLNGDSSGNYNWHYMQTDGATFSAGAATGSMVSVLLSYLPAKLYEAGMMGAGVVDILDYTNANKFKTIRSFGGCDTNNTGTEKGQLAFTSGTWRSLNAITSIKMACASDLTSGLEPYTQFALYGIKGE